MILSKSILISISKSIAIYISISMTILITMTPITTIALRRSGDEDSFLVYKEHTPIDECGYPEGVALYSEIFDFFEDDFSEREMKHGTAFTSTKEMIQYLEGEDIGYIRVANLTITKTAHWLKGCGEEFSQVDTNQILVS